MFFKTFRCRFQCAICLKLSSEKRQIREHVIRTHGYSMNEYEAQFGDCEIHTEYFFCGLCHSEVKHNLKNISLHLQNSHKMSPADYESQFGRMAEDEVVIAENQVQNNEFGAHFLLQEQNNDDNLVQNSLMNPPKADVANPKCKNCRVCNLDFQRR